MHTKTEHLSDEELLSFADGELKSSQAALVNNHLEACWSCRTRRTELEGTIASFIKAQREALDPMVPPAAGARALIKMRLAEAAQASQQPQWQFGLSRLRYLMTAGAMVVLLVAWILIYQRFAQTQTDRATEYLAEPDRKLTPGAVRPVSLNEICTGADEKNRAVSVAIQKQVFSMYGIPDAHPEDYEVDYLITPELGGSDDIRNLWPEPFGTTNWTAHVKDALEDRLHDMVCNGRLDLPTAQHEIASDWIGAYKKYFRTDKPLPEHYARSQDAAVSLMASRSPN